MDELVKAIRNARHILSTRQMEGPPMRQMDKFAAILAIAAKELGEELPIVVVDREDWERLKALRYSPDHYPILVRKYGEITDAINAKLETGENSEDPE